ncbi:hypothetical protein BCR33DRAFT_772693 [Rhizoclosmatium globosum]|uniref:Uncharacterized protein n=1 Tax=Rhizoclosmatium globosum TaxID=329046 RepID=A0A1Y2B2I7_9FUNG|nr:hypothetical protein BCR33DRAFT_772693 [Rhizoclosmatium globosum]|eukprot:ORY28707.1 hypothetical protein BCR33DRAFT_772693 [Rhizoclosmatium globosum]
MNTTIDSTDNTSSLAVNWSMAAFSLLEIFSLMFFCKITDGSLKQCPSPFNVFLLAACLSMTGFHTANAINIQFITDQLTKDVSMALMGVFLGTAELSILTYTLARAKETIELTTQFKHHTLLTYLISPLPIFVFVPVIPSLQTLISTTNAATNTFITATHILFSITILIVTFLLVITHAKFLRAANRGEFLDRRGEVVSQYGMVLGAFYIAVAAVYISMRYVDGNEAVCLAMAILAFANMAVITAILLRSHKKNETCLIKTIAIPMNFWLFGACISTLFLNSAQIARSLLGSETGAIYLLLLIEICYGIASYCTLSFLNKLLQASKHIVSKQELAFLFKWLQKIILIAPFIFVTRGIPPIYGVFWILSAILEIGALGLYISGAALDQHDEIFRTIGDGFRTLILTIIILMKYKLHLLKLDVMSIAEQEQQMKAAVRESSVRLSIVSTSQYQSSLAPLKKMESISNESGELTTDSPNFRYNSRRCSLSNTSRGPSIAGGSAVDGKTEFNASNRGTSRCSGTQDSLNMSTFEERDLTPRMREFSNQQRRRSVDVTLLGVSRVKSTNNTVSNRRSDIYDPSKNTTTLTPTDTIVKQNETEVSTYFLHLPITNCKWETHY